MGAPEWRASHGSVAEYVPPRRSGQVGLAAQQLRGGRNLGRVYFAPADVVLSDTNVVQPDLLFVSREREHIITRPNIQGAPDLAVEIGSPSTDERDRTVKRKLYAEHGVKEYWLVDPDAMTVTVLLHGERDFEEAGVYRKGETLTSPILQGFSVDLDDIFRP